MKNNSVQNLENANTDYLIERLSLIQKSAFMAVDVLKAIQRDLVESTPDVRVRMAKVVSEMIADLNRDHCEREVILIELLSRVSHQIECCGNDSSISIVKKTKNIGVSRKYSSAIK